MATRGNMVRALARVAIFILLEVASLHILVSNSTIQNFFFAKWFHSVEANLWGRTESIKHYFSLDKDNRRLSEENFRLRQEIIRLNSVMDGVDGQARADSFSTANGDARFSFISGTVLKMSNNTQHNYIILGQGSADGVKPKSGIVTSNGAIGIVDAVSKHYSYAMSFMNTGVSVSARIGSDRAVGPLTWDGRSNNGALLKEIPLQNRFEPGDTVYTSGFSSIFPPDIPLGTIQSSKTINGATYEIKVNLLENFKGLRYVTIVNNEGEAELEELEKSEMKSGKKKK